MELRQRRRTGDDQHLLQGGVARAPVSLVSSWSVRDVVQCLNSAGLGALSAKFEEHQVDGQVLVSMDEHDLSYMGVRALGQRKKVLALVSSLARGKAVGPPSPAAPVPPAAARGGALQAPSITMVFAQYTAALVIFFVLHWACHDRVMAILGRPSRNQAPAPTPVLLSRLRQAQSQLQQQQAFDDLAGGVGVLSLNNPPPPH